MSQKGPTLYSTSTDKIHKCNKTANINVKNFQFKTVCNGDTAYITQLKQQIAKGAITVPRRLGARWHYGDMRPNFCGSKSTRWSAVCPHKWPAVGGRSQRWTDRKQYDDDADAMWEPNEQARERRT